MGVRRCFLVSSITPSTLCEGINLHRVMRKGKGTYSNASKIPISYSDGHSMRRSRSLPVSYMAMSTDTTGMTATYSRSPRLGNMPKPPKIPICAQNMPCTSSG